MSEFTVRGVAELKRDLAALLPKIRASAKGASTDTAQAIQETARSLARVDTGEMRDLIRVHETSDGAEVRAEAEHSPYHEFGTSEITAQPFLGPAADGERQRYSSRVIAEARKRI